MIRIALRTALATIALAMLLAPAVSLAQEPGNVPETKAPPPSQAAPPSLQAIPATHPDNEYWRKHDQQLLTDFGWLARFREA